MKKASIKKLIGEAESYCAEKAIRFTAPRRHVLEIIATAGKPLGAYDILSALAEKIDNPKPPTAYRAIEFLESQGFIHRIESLNAYVLCATDHRHDGSQFLICDSCGTVIEAHLCDLPAPLADKAKAAHFAMERWNVELHGTCRQCQ